MFSGRSLNAKGPVPTSTGSPEISTVRMRRRPVGPFGLGRNSTNLTFPGQGTMPMLWCEVWLLAKDDDDSGIVISEPGSQKSHLLLGSRTLDGIRVRTQQSYCLC